jgi:hypothetical protein
MIQVIGLIQQFDIGKTNEEDYSSPSIEKSKNDRDGSN